MPLWIALFVIFGLYLVDRHNRWQWLGRWMLVITVGTISLAVVLAFFGGLALIYLKGVANVEPTIADMSEMIAAEIIVVFLAFRLIPPLRKWWLAVGPHSSFINSKRP